MAHAEAVGTFPAADGYSLHFHRYQPDHPARAAVVAIHGIQSHAGWYRQSCEALRQQGFDVFFVDRRGSGLNDKDRGFAQSARQLIDDLVRAVQMVRELVPDRPVVLEAISWGGKLAVATLARHPGLVDGLVLVCPGLFARVGPTPFERWQVATSFVFRPRRPIRIPLTDPELFTANPDWQSFLRDDPLMLRVGTSRLMMSSVILDLMVARAARRITVPTRTILAGRDRIIDNDRVRDYVGRIPESSIIEYASAHHTLEFEPDPSEYFQDLADWMIALVDGSALPRSVTK